VKVKGYGCEAEWDGTVLRARGTNKAAHKALAGDLSHEGDVLVRRADIVRTSYKPPSRITNGRVNIRTGDGRRYQLHFLKKHNGFDELARQLGADL
jgi:hypothetical protein